MFIFAFLFALNLCINTTSSENITDYEGLIALTSESTTRTSDNASSTTSDENVIIVATNLYVFNPENNYL